MDRIRSSSVNGVSKEAFRCQKKAKKAVYKSFSLTNKTGFFFKHFRISINRSTYFFHGHMEFHGIDGP